MLGFVEEKKYEAQVLVLNECQVLREVAGAYQSQVLKKYESQVLKSMRVRCGKSQVLKKIWLSGAEGWLGAGGGGGLPAETPRLEPEASAGGISDQHLGQA